MRGRRDLNLTDSVQVVDILAKISGNLFKSRPCVNHKSLNAMHPDSVIYARSTGFEPAISSVTGRRVHQVTLRPHFNVILKYYFLPRQKQLSSEVFIHYTIEHYRIIDTILQLSGIVLNNKRPLT